MIARDPVIPGDRHEIRDRSCTAGAAPDPAPAARRGLPALAWPAVRRARAVRDRGRRRGRSTTCASGSRATRWPDAAAGLGWEHGADFAYLRELCEHWRGDYDWRAARAGAERALELALGRDPRDLGAGAADARGVAAPDRLPVLLLHGWPGRADRVPRPDPGAGRGGPRRRRALAARLRVLRRARRRRSTSPGSSARLRELMAALGYERYAVQGGDWGVDHRRPDGVRRPRRGRRACT